MRKNGGCIKASLLNNSCAGSSQERHLNCHMTGMIIKKIDFLLVGATSGFSNHKNLLLRIPFSFLDIRKKD